MRDNVDEAFAAITARLGPMSRVRYHYDWRYWFALPHAVLGPVLLLAALPLVAIGGAGWFLLLYGLASTVLGVWHVRLTRTDLRDHHPEAVLHWLFWED